MAEPNQPTAGSNSIVGEILSSAPSTIVGSAAASIIGGGVLLSGSVGIVAGYVVDTGLDKLNEIANRMKAEQQAQTARNLIANRNLGPVLNAALVSSGNPRLSTSVSAGAFAEAVSGTDKSLMNDMAVEFADDLAAKLQAQGPMGQSTRQSYAKYLKDYGVDTNNPAAVKEYAELLQRSARGEIIMRNGPGPAGPLMASTPVPTAAPASPAVYPPLSDGPLFDAPPVVAEAAPAPAKAPVPEAQPDLLDGVKPAPSTTPAVAAAAQPAPIKTAAVSASTAHKFTAEDFPEKGFLSFFRHPMMLNMLNDPLIGGIIGGVALELIGSLKDLMKLDSPMVAGMLKSFGLDKKEFALLLDGLGELFGAPAAPAPTQKAASAPKDGPAIPQGSPIDAPDVAMNPLNSGGKEAGNVAVAGAHAPNRAGMKAADAAQTLDTAAPIPVVDRFVTNVRFDSSKLTPEQLATVNKLSDVTTSITLATQIIGKKSEEAKLVKDKKDPSTVKYTAEEAAFVNDGKFEKFVDTIAPGLKATLTPGGAALARTFQGRDVAEDNTTKITSTQELREKLPQGTFAKVPDAQIIKDAPTAGTPEPAKVSDAAPKAASGRTYAQLKAQGDDIGPLEGPVTQDKQLAALTGVPGPGVHAHGPKPSLLAPQVVG